MATAGRVLIIPRGDYDGNYTYEMLDMVNHNKATWIAKRESVGIEPSDDSAEHWFRLLGVGVLNSASIANNVETTEEGLVLDARQGKLLMDAIMSVGTEVVDLIAATQTALDETNASLLSLSENVTEIQSKVSEIQGNATIIRGTLANGSTSVVLTDERLTSDSMLSIYTSVWGVNPTSVTVESGLVTLGFDAQTVVVEVGVRIDG